MKIIQRHAHARAGLIGNPSDGYHGKTIALIVPDFQAKVTLYPWEELELIPSQEDHSRFRSVHDLVRDVELHGYYGGIRLVKATITKFVRYCASRGLSLGKQNFSVRYETNIPRQVGLAGSSAIIVATLRCLIDFYQVELPIDMQPSLVLSVETDELGLPAGLQDRVIQVHEGLIHMDFSRDVMHTVHGFDCGRYESLDPALLPKLYLAYSTDVSEPTEIFHGNLRARHEQGEPAVVKAMIRLAELTDRARDALVSGRQEELGQLLDENFDIRRSISRLPTGHERMVEVARDNGVTAKFAGSGGAIIGTYANEATLARLIDSMRRIHCDVRRLT